MPIARIARTLFALVVFALNGAGPGRAEPVVSETVQYYDVSGADARAVRASLNRNGPVSATDGKRYDAVAKWNVAWRYRYKPANGRCAITSASTEVKATIAFPRLQSDANTPAELKASFANYAEKLMLHEKGHVQNAIDAARRIETGIRALPPEPTCALLEAAANKLAHALIKEANQADIDYDARTQHGRTQGVRFP
jgi:predicted secreted Zn-dependent protease